MKSLQLAYSKELAKALGKIAIYLPGEEVAVGDIIRFPYGERPLFRNLPLGSFRKISSLSHLGLTDITTTTSSTPDSYRYTSNQSTSLKFDTEAQASLAHLSLPKATGDLHIQFSNTGALCFFAVNCYKEQLDHLAELEHRIDSSLDMIWENTFLVTSVTTAQRALIIQSHSDTAEIVLSGHVQGLQSNAFGSVQATADIHIQRQSGNLLVKDWSDQTSVFMDVVRFDPQIFDFNYKTTSIPIGLTTTNRHQLTRITARDLF